MKVLSEDVTKHGVESYSSSSSAINIKKVQDKCRSLKGVGQRGIVTKYKQINKNIVR